MPKKKISKVAKVTVPTVVRAAPLALDALYKNRVEYYGFTAKGLKLHTVVAANVKEAAKFILNQYTHNGKAVGDVVNVPVQFACAVAEICSDSKAQTVAAIDALEITVIQNGDPEPVTISSTGGYLRLKHGTDRLWHVIVALPPQQVCTAYHVRGWVSASGLEPVLQSRTYIHSSGDQNYYGYAHNATHAYELWEASVADWVIDQLVTDEYDDTERETAEKNVRGGIKTTDVVVTTLDVLRRGKSVSYISEIE